MNLLACQLRCIYKTATHESYGLPTQAIQFRSTLRVYTTYETFGSGRPYDHGPIQMVSKLELRLFFKPPINLTVFNHFEIKDHITKHNLPIFHNFKFKRIIDNS